MKPAQGTKSVVGLLVLLVGIVFCTVLFGYGVTQEVPIGKLEGTIILTETGKPLPGAQVSLSAPDDDSVRDRIAEADSKGRYRFRNVRAGEYEIHVYAQEHNAKSQRITVTEGRPTRFDIRLVPTEPYLKIYASQRVWTTGDEPQVELHGFRAGELIHVEVDRVAFQKLLESGHFAKAVSALRTQEGFTIPPDFEKYSKKELEFRHKVKNRDSEGAFVEPLNLSTLAEGIYWVRCSGNGVKAAAYINVTHVALVTKTAKGRALAYVTDLSSGKPIPGARVWSQNSTQKILSVKTGTDGLVETSYASSPTEEASRACIIAEHGSSIGMVGVYTNDDSESSGKAKFVIYTDRPIYKPGDEVQFKGVVRRKSGSEYLPPQSGTVDIQINDTDDEPIAKLTARVSSHGSFIGHFQTSKEAGPGLYRIVAKGFGGRGSHFVDMLAYRKPELSVQIRSLKPYYVIGEKAEVAIKCMYYYGGPVVGATVKGTIYQSSAMSSEPDDDFESQGSRSYQGGDYSKAIDVTTNAKGEAIVQFETLQVGDKSIPLSDLDFNVNVNVTDPSKKFTDGTGTVRAVRGGYNLSAICQNYLVSPGDMIDLQLRTNAYDSKHSPVGSRLITVQASSEEWDGNTSKLIPRSTYRAVTGPDGVVHLAVKAEGKGTLRLKAFSKDDTGKVIVTDTHSYILGGRWNSQADQSRLEVVLNKRSYGVGDSAKLMIRTIAPGGSALVTVQTDSVLWKRVVPLNEDATTLDIPVTANFIPNCFVSVAYVHKKKFFEGDARLTVQPGNQRLNVTVEADKPEIEPGGVEKLTVHTADINGHPVSAEVSLGVVDESIYAIREDSFNIFESFYPKRMNAVTTSYSFSEVYLDGGDKGGANVAIRKRFLDTAAWLPSVQTDATGTARVSVTLPDNLTEWRTTAIAVTDTTSVGKAVSRFRARKKLMVRLEMPEFLVQSDERQMTVIVTNDTGSDKEVHFSASATGVSLTGELNQTLHVAADRPTSITFGMKTGNPGRALVTAKAWIDDGANDGVQQGFPVYAHGVAISNAWADELNESKDFALDLNTKLDRTTGRVKITLGGSLAGNLVNSLDGLIGFPYGCVEQTMSRFMPSILVAKTVKDLGFPRPKLEQQIPKIAGDSMVRLGRMQHEDGGWGWWQNDKSDPFMTALVLDGLDRCKQAEFPIRKVNIEKALAWCDKRARSKEWVNDELRGKCYVIYALAKYGHTQVAKEAYAGIRTRKTSAADRATLVLATHEMGPDFKAERDRMMDRLIEIAHQGPKGAYWDSSDSDWGSESSALALTAVMTVRPTDPIAPRIVRYLMAHRKGDMWDSTRDTSYSLIGMTRYLAATHELVGKMDVKVLVNGVVAKKAHIDASKAESQSLSLLIPLAELHSGPNTIRVEKSGVGTCYFTMEMQGTEIQPQIAASQPIPGLRIERKYFRMEARKLEDGTMMMMPTKRPVKWAESGDIVRVELTVQSSKARQFILIEDPTPSNCRVTDREELDSGEEWSFWWDRFVIRDEKVAFFVRNLREGKQTLTYTMRAEGLGLAHALPTTLSNMYDVKERASGAETMLEVK